MSSHKHCHESKHFQVRLDLVNAEGFFPLQTLFHVGKRVAYPVKETNSETRHKIHDLEQTTAYPGVNMMNFCSP